MKYASFGSISTGTLRTADLLESFAAELEHQLRQQPKSFKRREYRNLINEANRVDPESDEASEIIDELQTMLSDFAPPYGYFGTLEGDGADFGFWLSSDMVDTFRDEGGLVVSDLSEVPSEHRGEFLHVNDHGNVSLYVAQSRGKVREIWAVV